VAGEPILIVDDNPANLKLARVMLTAEGYEVRVAVDAEEALSLLADFRPRLILMDLQLPGMDGLTLTRRLKDDPATCDVAIVALTAYAMKGDEDKAMQARLRRLHHQAHRHSHPAHGHRPLPRRPQPAGRAMSGNIVLVVEDNPITRKMMRVALESAGYRVLEAGDGRSALAASAGERPDLVVLDYVLPDADGMQLLEDLRRQPGGAALPALLVTGMVSRLGELRSRAGELTQLLPKPIEPSRLLEVVRAHLAAPRTWGAGRTVLVVDDDPFNLKLAALLLANEDYVVGTAASGAEALERVRAAPPDAILAHVGMPGMDGFALCREVRADPSLAAVPVILFSSAYLDDADRELARQMGASALVARSPDLRAASAALREALRGGSPPAPASPSAAGASESELAALYRQRVQVQLERQTAQNRALMRQAGIQATALALMRSLTEVLGQPANVPQVIGDVLVQCLDAAGLSTGLLYMVEPDNRYRLQALSGIAAGLRQDAESCFGHPEILQGIVAQGRPAALGRLAAPEATAGGVSAVAAADFLARMGRASALVVPFVVMGETFGVLVLAADHQELSDSSWLGFAGSLAVQFGQTVALGQSLNRLAASEERYRALMEQANDAILILDLERRILQANHAALRLLGWPRSEIVGRLYDDLVAPEEDPAALRINDTLMREGRVRVPLRHLVRADGARVPVEVSGALVHVGDESTIFVILHDLTERRRLEAQFQQAQKMESVGRLAGGVAHDFNNLLTLILGYGTMVLGSLGDQPELRKQVQAIVRAGESATALTRQLLAFSRRQVLVPTVVDVNALIRQLEHMLQRLIGEDIELITDLEPALGRIRADAGQIEQVLMNLVVNARDAMPGGGRLTLSTRNRPPAAAAAAAVPGGDGGAGGGSAPTPDEVPPSAPAAGVAGAALAPATAEGAGGIGASAPLPGAHVLLQVADTGSGIDSALLPHLFEPFFTTKDEGKGTGLGLATVYGIVHQSGGRIEVESAPGQGATFSIFLPCTDEPLPAAGAATAAPGRGHETILVAEDNAPLRELARKILAERGYSVLEAATAAEALQVAAGHTGPIHLLLTDVIMPGKSGVELAEALLARRPGLRVVYMSGYADRAVQTDAPGVAFVQKPFDPGQLAHRVRAVLDQ
jgi:two-component system, cell cycle sensor histidine kinase and response regulator CckA